MKCIIVDDEPLAREGMELNLQEVEELELIGQFSSAMAANSFLADNAVDLMFLDIQMPGITGLEFLKSLEHQPLVIMTTAYPEYALQGFELNVVDYLVKPIRLQRFVQAINKARELYKARQPQQLDIDEEDEFMYVKSDRKFVRVKFDDIMYVEGMKDYVILVTDQNQTMINMNIKTIGAKLDPQKFVRISKSYIINLNYIEEIDYMLIKIRGKEIPIGRTYKEFFMDTFIKGRLMGK